MKYLAHSAKPDCPSQSYLSHVEGVHDKAEKYAVESEKYFSKDKKSLSDIVGRSALWHDLGKLDDENQTVLHEISSKKKSLPWRHSDAGSAALKESGSLYSAFLVYSHHSGLPDMNAELIRENNIFRDEKIDVTRHFDNEIEELIKRHFNITATDNRKPESSLDANRSVFLRMALSCLADADHTDTAIAYNQAPENEELPQLRAKERLEALNRYVSMLKGDDERSRMRGEMYTACLGAHVDGGFSACDGPVGTGKTTAIMAHLLMQAIRRKSRKVFVILPYTNIIKQSVDIYRKALTLPGEDPNEVVAELHCRADFQDKDTRYLTSLWRAPIIVTTAVAFFETIASNRPSALRRFHELPGSVIFIDEAHNALPLKLLPLAWRWMNTLSEEWGCYWVLASGSLVRYWQLDSLSPVEMPHPYVKELIDTKLKERLLSYEQQRVSFRFKSEALSRKELVQWVHSSPGPRLLILNTVQSAAVIADDLSDAYGRKCVEHLSTALTAEDRNTTIERIKARLANERDTNWTLVATSCVEAGVDFSFRNGFRELSSLLSLLQASGRVNRNGIYEDADMWSFTLQDDPMLKSNTALDISREVLKGYFEKELDISPQLSTKSMNDELIRDDSCISMINRLNEMEEEMQFETIADKFEVIEARTVPVVVDEELAELISQGKGDWRLLQQKSVSIRREKIIEWCLKELATGVYQWTLRYDPFLGYMLGVLDVEKSKHESLIK